MATDDEVEGLKRKLDRIERILILLTPDVLPAGLYEVRIRSVEEKVSRLGRKYWSYKFEYELLSGRYVWGNYVDENKPWLSTIGARCKVNIRVSNYNDQPSNVATEVFMP